MDTLKIVDKHETFFTMGLVLVLLFTISILVVKVGIERREERREEQREQKNREQREQRTKEEYLKINHLH